MPGAVTIRSLADICEDQWGLFTRKQAESTGMAWSTLARLVRNGVALRVARGVYRLRGNASPENIDLCAAWLQLAPDIMAWQRITSEGVVCRWSAASVCGLTPTVGVHQFSLPVRRQTRRPDVKLYKADLAVDEVVRIGGLLVTAPGRIVADLLGDGEDLVAVAHVAAGALGGGTTTRAGLAVAVAPYAAGLGFADHDGLSLVDWLTDLAATPHEFALLRDRGNATGEATRAGQQIHRRPHWNPRHLVRRRTDRASGLWAAARMYGTHQRRAAA